MNYHGLRPEDYRSLKKEIRKEVVDEMRSSLLPLVPPEPSEDPRFKVYERAIATMAQEQEYLFPSAMSPWQFRSDHIYMGHAAWGTGLKVTTLNKLVDVIGRAMIEHMEDPYAR